MQKIDYLHEMDDFSIYYLKMAIPPSIKNKAYRHFVLLMLILNRSHEHCLPILNYWRK